MMSELINNIQKNLLRPVIKEIEKICYSQLKSELRENLNANIEALKGEAQKDTEELIDFILDKDGLQLLEEGFTLAVDHLDQLPNKTAVINNLKACSNRFLSTVERQNNSEKSENQGDTLAERLGIEADTYNSFYQIGANFFNMREFDKALRIFTFVIHLNPMVFEPWFGLGICWQKKEEPIKALTAFSMASIIIPSHPGPHIHSAKVYVNIEQYRLAEDTLEFAKKMCNPEQLHPYQKDLDGIKSIIDRRP